MPYVGAIEHDDVDLFRGEIEGGQQTYHSTANDDYFLLGHLGLRTLVSEQRNGFSDPNSLWQ